MIKLLNFKSKGLLFFEYKGLIFFDSFLEHIFENIPKVSEAVGLVFGSILDGILSTFDKENDDNQPDPDENDFEKPDPDENDFEKPDPGNDDNDKPDPDKDNPDPDKDSSNNAKPTSNSSDNPGKDDSDNEKFEKEMAQAKMNSLKEEDNLKFLERMDRNAESSRDGAARETWERNFRHAMREGRDQAVTAYNDNQIELMDREDIHPLHRQLLADNSEPLKNQVEEIKETIRRFKIDEYPSADEYNNEEDFSSQEEYESEEEYSSDKSESDNPRPSKRPKND